MSVKKAAAKPLARKKAAADRNSAGSGKNGRPIFKLPLEGKIKRADIRKAVQAVFREKARTRASS